MFFPEGGIRVYLYGAPCDMRKSFDGLTGLIKHAMGEDPLSGHLFVFVNRRGNYLKALYWDRTGYRRTKPVVCPVIEPVKGLIDTWLEEDKERHRKQRHTAKRIFFASGIPRDHRVTVALRSANSSLSRNKTFKTPDDSIFFKKRSLGSSL